jgi:hypothetical protein
MGGRGRRNRLTFLNQSLLFNILKAEEIYLTGFMTMIKYFRYPCVSDFNLT